MLRSSLLSRAVSVCMKLCHGIRVTNVYAELLHNCHLQKHLCSYSVYFNRTSYSILHTNRTQDNSGSKRIFNSSNQNIFLRSKAYSSSTGERGAPKKEVEVMEKARIIFDQAVSSVLPHQMIKKNLTYNVSSSTLQIANQNYQLKRNVYVVGFGKAVLGMARALEDCIGDHIVEGVVSIPVGSQEALKKSGLVQMLLQPSSKISAMEGAADNLPDEAAHVTAQRIASVTESVGADDILIVLISGGGSALLPAPIPPLTLSDMLSVTKILSRSGVDILNLNMMRKQLDILKGGGIARLARPAQVISLVLSDIVGDDLSFIASGPTVSDMSTAQECLDLISCCGVEASVPPAVMSLLKSKSTENKDQCGEVFSHVQNVLIGTNKIACDAAYAKAADLGFLPYVLSTKLSGEVRHVGVMFSVLSEYIVELLRAEVKGNDGKRTQISSLKQKLLSCYDLSEQNLSEIASLVNQVTVSNTVGGICIITGGETTVNVKGKGKGGRNQEMAVEMGVHLHKLFCDSVDNPADGFATKSKTRETPLSNKSCQSACVSTSELDGDIVVNNVVFLSGGTDGQDGPTSAAGAVVDVNFVKHTKKAGLDIHQYLDDNDSFTLLSNLDSGSNLVITGLTGTNVMDIQLLLIQVQQSETQCALS